MTWSLPRFFDGREAPRVRRHHPGSLDLDDELLGIGEEEALRRTLDDVNGVRLGRQLWFFAVVTVVYTLVKSLEGPPWAGVAAGVVAAADLLLLRELRAPAVARNIRQVAAAVLILHLLLFQLFHGLGSEGLGFWFIVFPLLASRFRVTSGESLAIIGTLYGLTTLRLLGESVLTKDGAPIAALIGYGVVHGVGFLVAWWSTRRDSARFLGQWRAASIRHRDRLRMKRELEYAREIQLSMLPRAAPQPGWLQIASLSLPATEVGGDYYDYFPLDERRLAVVVGDVTGHGVASGLVLSGVRSCLNLLHDDLGRPADVLGKVNRMLKRTTARRMLMTLGVAVFDEVDRTLTVSTAGHPPALVVRAASGVVDEVGRGSFPLGAMAAAEYMEHRVTVEPGDIVVMYSDGLVETMNADREQFGWDRLRAVLTGAASAPTAADVRDAILREVWDFKGHTAQVDDVTMVVARCLAPSREVRLARERSTRLSEPVNGSPDLAGTERGTGLEQTS